MKETILEGLGVLELYAYTLFGAMVLFFVSPFVLKWIIAPPMILTLKAMGVLHD